jgi:putative ABC transport system permease protein
MFTMIFQKLMKSRWLVLSLLSGLVAAVALISSIPMYTDGILQRLLTKDLEEFQLDTGKYPGTYLLEKTFRYFSSGKFHVSTYPWYHEYITERLSDQLNLPIVLSTHRRKLTMLRFLPEIQKEENPRARQAAIETGQDLEEHITILHGRLYSEEKQDGVFETIVSEQAVKDQDLHLGDSYVLVGPEKIMPDPLTVRVVGVFSLSESEDAYWYKNLASSRKSFFINEALYDQEFSDVASLPDFEADWFYALDYHQINLRNYRRILSVLNRQVRSLIKNRISFDIPIIGILEEYIVKERRLKLTLAFLQIPVLLMLAFFLYMVSLLIIEREKNEIAVLKSRGASKMQVFLIYLYANLVVSFIALIIGPLFGLLICHFLGATNGFLEFVRRKALPITLSWRAYTYSLVGIAIFMVAILLPAFFSSRTTIVLYKQKIARRGNTQAWKRFFFDVILIAISLYGLYRYYSQQRLLFITGVEGAELPIDPLLFVISTLFIFGVGLLFLRLFPYLFRFLFWVGRRVWPPELYASFINVGRSLGYEQFVMIFLILTVAIGVFNSTAARTINKNVADRIYYANGADISLKPYQWYRPPLTQEGMPRVTSASTGSQGPYQTPETSGSGYVLPRLVDPMSLPGLEAEEEDDLLLSQRDASFKGFADLTGVEKATKVFRVEYARVQSEQAGNLRAMVMGIFPHEFGDVAWFRAGLLPYHWYHYLNLLSHSPDALLVSRSFAERYRLQKGDPLSIAWGELRPMEGFIYAFVDYWPTFNPHETTKGRRGVETPSNLIIANLSYLEMKMGAEATELWLDKDEGVPSEEIYREMKDKGLGVLELKDSTLEIIVQKNNPVLQGTNGMLTLGFLVTLGVSLLGFLICWVLSMQGRTLQFGVLRAMGLARKRVVAIIVWELVLISGSSVLMGILIGGIAGQLYVPLLQLVTSVAQQVPPFVVGALRKDYGNLLFFVLAMFVGVLVVLAVLISRIRIHQAIKLGEE